MTNTTQALTMTATERTSADMAFFADAGELPAHSPTDPDMLAAIADFDGSSAAFDYIWYSLFDLYEAQR